MFRVACLALVHEEAPREAPGILIHVPEVDAGDARLVVLVPVRVEDVIRLDFQLLLAGRGASDGHISVTSMCIWIKSDIIQRKSLYCELK